MKFTLRKPCPKCPFRTDIPPSLTKGAAREICAGNMERATFQCHQTVDYDEQFDADDNHIQSAYAKEKNAQHCAGALLVMVHMQRLSQMARIVNRLGLFDPTRLDKSVPVFKTFAAFIKAQKR